jgi:hypothetical protein
LHGYHATFLGRLDQIAQGGLRRSGGSSQFNGGYSAHSKGRVFLTEWRGVSFWMNKMEDIANHNTDWDDPESATGWMPVTLRVDMTELADRLGDDEVGTQDARSKAWYIEEDIPADLIEAWNGSRWVPVKSVDPEDMADKARELAEYESDDDEPYDDGGDNDGWWTFDLGQFVPSKKASSTRVARRWRLAT